MSLSLLTRSTIPWSSSSSLDPIHVKVKNSSGIHFAQICCEQKQSKDEDNRNTTTTYRRHVLLGLGGLYAASATLNNTAAAALAAPASPTSEVKKTLLNNVNFWWWKNKGKEIKTQLPSADAHASVTKEHAEVSSELIVDLPADEIWAVYSSPDLPRLIVELLPDRFEKIDIVEGDGGEGTVLHIVLNPASSGPRIWNERIEKIDHKTRTKVVRQIEGGYLAMGFHTYEHIFTITEKDANSCIIRMTASFDVDEESESNASLVTPNWSMGKGIANYVTQNKANSQSKI